MTTKFRIPPKAAIPKPNRTRISIVVPNSVLNSIKTLAKLQGLKYQTYINQLLYKTTRGPESMDDILKEVSQLFPDT